jgi:CTP synthase
MSACLRDLELIPLADISDDNKGRYIRIASIDSPFREQISWAFIQVVGRPGVPDRDLKVWINEISEAVRKAKEGNRQ